MTANFSSPYSYPPVHRNFLSPMDAFDRPVRCWSHGNNTDGYRNEFVPMITSRSCPSETSSNSLPTKTTTEIRPAVCVPTQTRDIWAEGLEEKDCVPEKRKQQLTEPLRGGEKIHQQTAYQQSRENPRLGQDRGQAGQRRFSEQDIKTRLARASLPSAQKHRTTVSYPIYSPSALSRGSTPPYLPWGLPPNMDPPRLYSRSPSASSNSITSRSSFESRHKSPLSISSSIDYESSRTSEDSSYSESKSSKDGFLATKSTIPPTAFHGKRLVNESLPMHLRYGAGGGGRQQTTLLPPQRVGMGPKNTTISGRAYIVRGEGFKKLPEEILLVILAELKKSHLDAGSLSCSTCYMRDLINLGLSCKKWWGAARCALYEDIQLIGCDSVIQTKKKFKLKFGTRLRLLRRTLRTRPDLAEYVKALKVPAMPEVAKRKKEQDEYLELVASLIMACPNLERLPGFYPTYNHEFSRFVHALSTRRKLTERIWIINPSPFQRQRRFNLSADAEYLTPVLAPSSLLPEECIDFMIHHSNWAYLKTLFFHCNPGGTIDSPLFTDIFNSLPSLENLHVSSFPATAFNDETLLLLPPLKSLRLDNLPGITANGLSSYGSPSRTDALTSLSLIGLPLLSLPVLTRLFSHLKSLTHFTISQAPSPSLPRGIEIYLHPYLASPTLQYLHWEITNPDDDRATEILAKAIFFNGFPSLRTIRAPTDHDGILQRLCKPRERIELPADRYRNMSLASIPHPQSAPSLPSPTRTTFSAGHHSHTSSINSSFAKSPTRSAFSLNLDKKSSHSSQYSSNELAEPDRAQGMSLASARRMAQHRIDAAVNQPRFHIILWDEHGQFVEKQGVAGFLGRIQSKIFYTLKPDVEGSDEAIVNIEGPGGLLDMSEEAAVRDGCTGSWNLDTSNGSVGVNGRKSKKDRERWWHTERGRWREVPLMKFF
ncbi:hypothetical protein BKA65DRAFT_520111 [Rhexocercosporidium sp. MPI-PUGE-AT-0058]|nr:hypothetical protein BKA65DRAFT_520111 [Rhexocercosporidium sp. MPI-PUGE-AT-0058]